MTLAVTVLIGLIVLALTARALVWAYVPNRTLPAGRVTHNRRRVRCRLYPGPGHANVRQLWWRWGRFAAFRGSKRARHSLTRWQRITAGPDAWSVTIGRAQHRHALRIPLEEHLLIMAPPRRGKTALLSRIVMRHPGAVLVTSTKPDVYALTSGLRAQRGRPVAIFNPQGIGGDMAPSTFRWSPVRGCEDRATAIRRADAFANALPQQGSGDNKFFHTSARAYMRVIFHAAALTAGGDMRLVARWANSAATGGAAEAERIVRDHGAGDWATELAQLHGPAERTNATNEIVMGQMIGFMADPALAEAVLPSGDDLDLETFLRQAGTLYMIADPAGNEEPPLAPLFAALCTEVVHEAARIGQASPGGRLDPPLFLGLDEIVQVVPIPLPSILADAGGKGIQVCAVTHGLAQLQTRWKTFGAQAILDTCGTKILLPGITATDTLVVASKLCGKARYREKGQEHHSRHPVMEPEMISELPDWFALVLRGGLRPVVARIPLAWKDWSYRKAKWAGWAVYQAPARVAAPAPLPELTPVMAPAVPAPEPPPAATPPAPVTTVPGHLATVPAPARVTVPPTVDTGQFPWLRGDL